MTSDVGDTSVLLGPDGWLAEVPAADHGPIDEYYARYRAVDPTLLHTQLMAGDEEQVQKVAASWNTATSCIDQVAKELRTVLTQAKAVWEGRTYDEFEREVLPVMDQAEAIAAKAQKMQSGLSMMSTMLAVAQQQAEAPPPPADAIYDVTGIITASLGYTPSQSEQLRIAARLVKLVAELSLKYFLVEQKVWNAPLPKPEPITEPDNADSGAASADQTPLSPLGGSPPAVPPEQSTHLVSTSAAAGGSNPIAGGMPTVPMAAAMHGGGESSVGRSRGWTSAETQWSDDGRPPWTEAAVDDDPDPVVGDRAVA